MEQLQTLAALASTHLEAILFYVLGIMAIPLAMGVISDKVIIRSGFLLIGVFGMICGLFLLLQAQFLALAQIMIYAVGITLVVVIALMLTNPKSDVEVSPTIEQDRVAGLISAVMIFGVIYLSLRSADFQLSSEAMNPNNVAVIGAQLTTQYALPFEFASVLLLAALIGAVMLAKADREPAVSPNASEDSVESKSEVYSGASR